MAEPGSHRLRGLFVIPLVLVATAVSLAAAPAPGASAAGAGERGNGPRAGKVTITLFEKAAKSLRRAGVKIVPTGLADSRAKQLRLPVWGGTAGSSAQLDNAGGLKLVHVPKRGQSGKRRVVRLSSLRTVLAEGRGYITARLRGQQVTLLRIAATGEAPYDPLTGAVLVSGTSAKFERSTAETIAARLGVERLPARVGALSIAATVTPAPSEQEQAPVRPRPPAAVDVISASLTWRARVSWIDYLHAAGDQGGTRTSNGAADGPAEVIPPSSDARVYQYDFPFASGWYDAASDTANVGFSGTVTFFKLIAPFKIDLDASNLVIELGGPSPHAIATLDGRSNNADQQNRRAVVVDLDQAAVTPTVTPGPGTTTYTWTAVPGKNPDGATAWPIAGYYQPGDAWGSVTISMTVAS